MDTLESFHCPSCREKQWDISPPEVPSSRVPSANVSRSASPSVTEAERHAASLAHNSGSDHGSPAARGGTPLGFRCPQIQLTPAQALSRALAWSLQTPAVLPRIPARGSRSSRWWRNVARSPAAVGYRSRSIAASKPFSAGQSVYSPIAGHGDRVLAAVFFDNSYPLFPPPFPPFLRSLLLPTTALVATRAPCEDGKEVRRGGR